MFTGIISAVGHIAQHQASGGDTRLTVNVGSLDMSDVALGDSIAVNGVCLTVVAFDQQNFTADVSRETMQLTSLNNVSSQSPVNLEKALRASDRLGGHLVSGHVDGLGEVIDRHDDARSTRFKVRVPQALARYIAKKGSICIDGTSLTVNEVEQDVFGVNIVPHTLQHTIMGTYQTGTAVNIEVDQIARYLERLLTAGGEHASATESDRQSQIQNQQMADVLAKAGYTA